MEVVNKKNIGRRNFLGSLSKATLFSTVGLAPGHLFAKDENTDSEQPETGHVFLTNPYLQVLSSSEMSIRWITNKPSYSWVEFGEGDLINQKKHRINNGFVTAYNCVHEIILNQLVPGKQYSYRVASKEILDFQPYKLTYGETIYSKQHTISAPDPAAKEVSCLVLNDIHDRPQSFGQLLKLNGEDPFDFMFLNGDMFDYQTDEKQLRDHLLVPCTEHFASNKPFMFVRGNHETRGKFARNLPDYFTNPGNQYFTFGYGPIFGIALDTGEDKEDTHPVYAGLADFDAFREKQAAWLEKQMQSKEYKRAKYRVVFMHIPPFYSGDWHGTMHCRKLFSPLFDKYKVDLVISGHTHVCGVHPPTREHAYPIVIGGGPKDGTRTLIKIKANQQTLDLRMIRDNAVEAGAYTIKARH
jgi:predicted phosphodiesterase